MRRSHDCWRLECKKIVFLNTRTSAYNYMRVDSRDPSKVKRLSNPYKNPYKSIYISWNIFIFFFDH